MIEQSTIWHMPRVAVFVEIVAAGSFTGAARRLKLSKSVVSSHLRELEGALGVRLLERSTRRQRLTDHGERFLPHAQRICRAWTHALQEATAARSEPTGTLRVTAPSMLGPTLVTRAVSQMSRGYPELVIDVDMSDQSKGLIEDGFDLAIRAGPLVPSELRTRLLGHDRDIIVATEKLAGRFSEARRPEQLVGAPWLVHAHLPARRTFLGPRQERVELAVRPRVRLSSASTLLELLRTGLGLGVFPAGVAKPDLDAGRLVQLLPQWHAGEIPIHAVWVPGNFQPPKVRRFIDVLAQIVKA